jgi:hypothetical protein
MMNTEQALIFNAPEGIHMYHRSLTVLITGLIILLLAVQGIATVNASGGVRMPPCPPSLPLITPTPIVTPVPAELPGPIAQPSPATLSSSAQGESTVSMDLFYQRPASAPATVGDPVLVTTGQEADVVGVLYSDMQGDIMSTGSVSPGGSNLSCASDGVPGANHQSTFVGVAVSWVGQLVSFISGGR